MHIRWLYVLLCLAAMDRGLAQSSLPTIPEIPRRIPPEGVTLSPEERASLERGTREFAVRLEKLRDRSGYADVAVYHKALDYALRHGEFFKEGKDAVLAEGVLAAGVERVAALERGETPWKEKTGPVVFGYRSAIDGSVQPYGLEIPAGLDTSVPAPLYVWLHGRGDTKTDLYFIAGRASKPGQRDAGPNSARRGAAAGFAFEDGIVLHPFGRQCIGWKSAGEVDVFEAIADVKKRYAIDDDRIALMGFSMGGAGAWHLGAHYADRWAVVHAGAGFAETARYNRLAEEDYPVGYEQTLWGLYDVPNYTRNLFNLPVLVYSGEEDKQIQAARVMEEAYAAHGRTLPHIIGPGMGHKYHPDSQEEVADFVADALEKGRDRFPKEVHLQTRTLRYPQMHWVRIEGLEEHWVDSRVDAELESETNMVIATENVSRLRLESPWGEGVEFPEGFGIEIDGWKLRVDEGEESLWLHLVDGNWSIESRERAGTSDSALRKKPGLQGPIDDAFVEPFLVVTPSGKSRNPKVQRWVEFELAHFRERWSELFRGDLRVKKDADVTEEDRRKYHLILWGDAESNRLMGELMGKSTRCPIEWNETGVVVSGISFPPENHVLTMIYPNPDYPEKYVVLNSGPTFREAHDRTNSLQNPKLPDWAVINLDRLPDGEAPGEIVAADFFDEAWRVKE